MGKFLKWSIISLILLAGVLVIAFNILRSNTKKYSPEQIVEFHEDGLDISVFYNRPYKNNREIFGGLVPYGEVWRTGANEPTTFTTETDIKVGGKKLPAGKYTLWTIPHKDHWEVIWNDKEYGWGITMLEGKASRKSEYDVLTLEVPVKPTNHTIEQFTISVDDNQKPVLFVMKWDDTKVEMPVQR